MKFENFYLMFHVEENDLRLDGRFTNELRRIVVSHGVNNNMSYILLEQGNTVVCTSLSKIDEKGSFNINLSFSTVSRSESMHERAIFEMKSKLINIFSSVICADYQVDLDINVKQDEGSLLAVIINSITLCLCYSGIPMKDMCIAVSLNNAFDLCDLESKQKYQMTFSFLISSHEIIYIECNGGCQKELFLKSIQNGIECCNIIQKQFSEFLINLVKAY